MILLTSLKALALQETFEESASTKMMKLNQSAIFLNRKLIAHKTTHPQS